jgi:hypothetical protein
MKKPRARNDKSARRAPAEISEQKLRAVSGGAMVMSKEARDKYMQDQARARASAPRPTTQPSMVGQVVNGVTVKKEWAAADGQVRWGSRGQVTGPRAVQLHADSDRRSQQFNSAMKKIGKTFLEMNPIYHVVQTARGKEKVGDMFKNIAMSAVSAVPGVGVAARVGVTAAKIGMTAAKVGTTAAKVGTTAGRIGTTGAKVGAAAARVGATAEKIGATAARIGSRAAPKVQSAVQQAQRIGRGVDKVRKAHETINNVRDTLGQQGQGSRPRGQPRIVLRAQQAADRFAQKHPVLTQVGAAVVHRALAGGQASGRRTIAGGGAKPQAQPQQGAARRQQGQRQEAPRQQAVQRQQVPGQQASRQQAPRQQTAAQRPAAPKRK